MPHGSRYYFRIARERIRFCLRIIARDARDISMMETTPEAKSAQTARISSPRTAFAMVGPLPLFFSRPVFLLQVAGGGTGFLRLWFAAPEGIGAKKEAFLFVNDSEGQNEECLLICMQGVCP